MSDQFDKPNFARGVKLTTQHVFPTLANMQTAAEDAAVEQTAEQLAPCRIMWHCPWVGAESAENGDPVCIWPWTVPPFQQSFMRSTLADPGYPVVLRELSVSFDQRAEPLGIVGPASTSTVGVLTEPDMDRYNLVIVLLERQPSTLASTNPAAPRELFRLALNGSTAFGSPFGRANPFVIDTLNVTIKPFMVYQWRIEWAGLFSANGVVGLPATVEQICAPSFTLTATLLSPLTVRDLVSDFAAPGIQNMPTKHNGAKTGTTIALTTPAADAIITGDDVQAAFQGFDVEARRRMPSGYGIGHGAAGNPMQAADAPPTEMLANDAYLSVIAIPMWGGQRINSVRAGDVATSGLPFAPSPFVAPWLTPTEDRRAIRIPSNFVIHHVFAVWNNYSPPAPNSVIAHIATGLRSLSANYIQRIGVAIQSGLRGDDYRYQQVAFLEFTGANADTFALDIFTHPGTAACYHLLNVPLVDPGVLWDGHTWQASGKPFFVGDANTTTQDRTDTGVMPGAGAFGPPDTLGQETMLEIRWQKVDAAAGLNDPANPRDVRVGQGGEFIYLVGRQTVAA